MTEAGAYPGKAEPAAPGASLRAGALLLLAAVELPFLAFLYDPTAINAVDPGWERARVVLREFVPLALFFLAALALVATPTRRALIAEWRAAAGGDRWRGWALANIAGFAALIAATIAFNEHGSRIADPPWALFGLWTLAVGALYAVLARALAPLSFWRRVIVRERSNILLAAGAAAFIEAGAILSRQSWNVLSEATFRVSAWLLGLYETDVVADPARRILGAGDFEVSIAAACSGYEGIGLVVTFLAIYLYLFRSVLRFPNAFLILPLGAAAIWTLNSVRIALLISLGAHVSPEIAVTGFHSQAGWIMFLIVTLGLMLATHRIGFFHDRAATLSTAPPSLAFREATALLAPFLAMTAAGILAAAFSGPENFWLYALRVVALAAALAAGWRYYMALDWRAGWTPIVLGLIVGAAWIATDPGRGEETALGAWLAGLSPAAAVAWIAMRLTGTILLVPVAEELAFRGYFHRKLIADKFEDVAEGAFSWKAFLVTALAFGLIHERWLAGALAGAVFALAMYRSGKVSGAIIAHMAANALIALWAVGFAQWSLF